MKPEERLRPKSAALSANKPQKLLKTRPFSAADVTASKSGRPTLAVRPTMKTRDIVSQGDVCASVTSLGNAETPIDIPTMGDAVESRDATARSTQQVETRMEPEIEVVSDANREDGTSNERVS